MLETRGVGGVARNRNGNVFHLHNGNAFGYVIRAVAFYFCSRSVGESYAVGNFYGFGVRIEFGLAVGKTVYSRNYISRVFAETVQYNP